MKPQRLILTALLATPGVPILGAIASNPSVPPVDLAVAMGSSLGSSSQAVPASISDQASSHRTASAKLSAAHDGDLVALDTSPLTIPAPPPLPDSGVVRIGDTLHKIAERYGLSLSQLLILNPGLETARLVVGSQVQVAQSSPGPGRSRLLLGLAPVGSGGISWPELPRFGPVQRVPAGSLTAGSFIWPAEGMLTSGYGWRWGRMHKGIDIANNVGTPVVAAAAGRVTFAGWHEGGYGYLVEITHPDGSLTRYGHNSGLLVREGDEVQRGQVISQMGSTGRSTGPHLHFEVLPPGEGATNPLAFLPPRL